MLPNENKPFADHHRDQLDLVLSDLQSILTSYTGVAVGITADDIKKDVNRISNARHAISRYEATVADEIRQKILYRDRWLDLRKKTSE